MVKKYGCFIPGGKMCIAWSGALIRARAMKAEDIDKLYSEAFRMWNEYVDFKDDSDYKDAVSRSSTIMFCDECGLMDKSECCRFRKGDGRELIY